MAFVTGCPHAPVGLSCALDGSRVASACPHSGQTLVAIQRLRGRKRFAALRANGRRARSGPVLVTFVPQDLLPAVVVSASTGSAGGASRHDPNGRVYVAFAIGRAVGGAVVRNRMRRRLRSIIAESNVAPGGYLVGARPEAATLSYEGLRGCTVSALESAAAGAGPRRAGPH